MTFITLVTHDCRSIFLLPPLNFYIKIVMFIKKNVMQNINIYYIMFNFIRKPAVKEGTKM